MAVQSTLALGRDELLKRFYARDPVHNGQFLVGVLTTGIYCLPACPAKKPKPENVRFFPDQDEARKVGLRACKRCRPDDFYRHHDPDRERSMELAAAVRADPVSFEDTGAMARRVGLGPTKLNALFRRHYHLTPADFLARARVDRAADLLFSERASVLSAAEASGFESPSTFHENFRQLTGMTPAAYRELDKRGEFTLSLPAGFRADELAGFFGRDPLGQTERVKGAVITQAALLDGIPVRIELDLAVTGKDDHGRVRLVSRRKLSRAAWREAHLRVTRWLGLQCDPRGFERRARRSRDIARLVRGRRGMRIPCSSSIFEGLVWVIVGAQVNVGFAATCRAALIELAGTRLAGGFIAHPTPSQVADLDYSDLQGRQYSRRKAEYLIDSARSIVAGDLDLEGGKEGPVASVQERLTAVRGLGPWSVQYLLLRGYGFEDSAPIGDVALAEAIKRFFELPERPGDAEAARLMESFAPHRSLATYHLWKTLP